jgi:hypothetical protein
MRWLRTELQVVPDLRSRALGPMLAAPPGELWSGFVRRKTADCPLIGSRLLWNEKSRVQFLRKRCFCGTFLGAGGAASSAVAAAERGTRKGQGPRATTHSAPLRPPNYIVVAVTERGFVDGSTMEERTPAVLAELT